MRNLHNLRKEIIRLMKSGDIGTDLGTRTLQYLRKLEHAVATRNIKEVKKQIDSICKLIVRSK